MLLSKGDLLYFIQWFIPQTFLVISNEMLCCFHNIYIFVITRCYVFKTTYISC